MSDKTAIEEYAEYLKTRHCPEGLTRRVWEYLAVTIKEHDARIETLEGKFDIHVLRTARSFANLDNFKPDPPSDTPQPAKESPKRTSINKVIFEKDKDIGVFWIGESCFNFNKIDDIVNWLRHLKAAHAAESEGNDG